MKQILLFIFSIIAFTSIAGEYSYKRNIHYKADSQDAYTQKMCTLDVAYTKGVSDAPVVVWFHGGGLTGGKKQVPETLCYKNIIVVGVEYRLYPEVKVPEIIDDAAAAVAWTFKNIESFGGSTKKIYVAGHSAGGYLTYMITLDDKYLSKYGISTSDIAGAIPYSGQVITHFSQRAEMGMEKTQPLIDSYAPLYHVKNTPFPFLILTADRELELLGRYEEDAYFWRMLKVNGHTDATLHELQGFTHGNMTTPGHYLVRKWILDREKLK